MRLSLECVLACLPLLNGGCNHPTQGGSDGQVDSTLPGAGDLSSTAVDDLSTTSPDLSGGAVDDLSLPPDLVTPGSPPCLQTQPAATATCTDIRMLIQTWIQCTSTCAAATPDCVVASFPQMPCRNPCPAVVGTNTDGPYLRSLITAGMNIGCYTAGCACLAPPMAACIAGSCARAP
jgi:hypothetical protein